MLKFESLLQQHPIACCQCVYKVWVVLLSVVGSGEGQFDPDAACDAFYHFPRPLHVK